MQQQRGFTLIELMIVVAVVAILAAIALPSYSRYIDRSRRVDAQNMLQHVATAQERYYSTYNRYSDDLADFGYSASPVTTPDGFYNVTLATANDDQEFTLEAEPQGSQADDTCGTLEITNTGKTDYSGNTHNGKCW